jgi:tRNA threonylcarbamoyladenosine biosynthesis protein TsaB
VSVLEALASLADRGGKIAAALDAGRKEVFFGMYEKAAEKFDQGLRSEREDLLNQQDFLATLKAETPASIITSDATIVELASASNTPINGVTRPGSEVIARIGAQKLLAGETVSAETLDANYLRRSDAELFFKGRR